jgi:integral membrane protein
MVDVPETGSKAPAPKARSADPIGGAMFRYRVMAYIVGTALIILVFVAIPLQYWGHHKIVAQIVAPIHGYLYIVYLIAGADLARRARWHLGRILFVVCGGFVPFLAFFVERWITRRMNAERAADAAAGSSLAPATLDSVDR